MPYYDFATSELRCNRCGAHEPLTLPSGRVPEAIMVFGHACIVFQAAHAVRCITVHDPPLGESAAFDPDDD